ncbi:60S ribosomal protein L36-2-like protein [Tanacetum coccineum]
MTGAKSAYQKEEKTWYEETKAKTSGDNGSKQPNAGLFVGLNKGHIVTKKELAPRPSDRKGKTSKIVHYVRRVIREVAGFSPYERRITELLKVRKDKRALKLAKQKLGSHNRAKKKREKMSIVLRKMSQVEPINEEEEKAAEVAATTETKILFSMNLKHGGKDDKFYETFKGANINVQKSQPKWCCRDAPAQLAQQYQESSRPLISRTILLSLAKIKKIKKADEIVYIILGFFSKISVFDFDCDFRFGCRLLLLLSILESEVGCIYRRHFDIASREAVYNSIAVEVGLSR